MNPSVQDLEAELKRINGVGAGPALRLLLEHISRLYARIAALQRELAQVRKSL